MKRVYFDNAATTPVEKQVANKMFEFINKNFGNPSSIHSYGRKAKVALEEAREICADAIGADASEVYFTSGGTESNNFLIRGIAFQEFEESGKNKLLTSHVEHKSVEETFNYLAANNFDINYSSVGKLGNTKYESVKSLLNDKFNLASFMFVNNETGAVNEISKLSDLCHSNSTYFHTDAVQAFGKIKIDVKKLGIDALSASAHKIGGPKGCGLAFIKSGTPIKPLINGGSQERNRRGGTENIAGIIGFAEAVKLSESHISLGKNEVMSLKKRLITQLKQIDNSNLIFNDNESSSPYILSITLNPEYYNNDTEAILMYLDINGIAVSAGSACTSGTLKPSHVILGCGYGEKYANGTIRFSFGNHNTFDEIDYVSQIFEKMLCKFKLK